MATLTTPPNPQRTIVLRCQTLGGTSYHEGRVAATKTVKPGHLVEQTTATGNLPDGDWQPHSTDGGNGKKMVALELGFVADVPYQTFSGGTIADSYAAGDLLRMHLCQPGDEVYVRIADGVNVPLNAFLSSAGDGTFEVTDGSDNILFMALEAVNNGTGADAFIRAKAL